MNTIHTSRATLAAAAVLLLGAGLAGGYWWAGHRQAPRSAAHDASAGKAAAGTRPQEEKQQRRILYWHDPMAPGTHFDKPGKSPFMDMDLVPVYADEEPTAGGVRIAANVRQNLGIRIGKAERMAMSRQLGAVGTVVFDERLTEVVQARVDGYVARLHVAAPLMRVSRGAPLVDVVAPAWIEAGREYLALLGSGTAAAQGLRDAARARLRVLGVPDAEVRRIEHDRSVREAMTLTAPADGVVEELGVRMGAAFMPGAALFRLNGLRSVWVNAEIPEAQLSRVPQGAEVTAWATAWPATPFKGHVMALLPSVNAATRTLTARVAVDNPDGRLAPGMYVKLEFEGPAAAPEITVPSEALIMTGERNIVIRALDDGSLAVAEVRPGDERAGRTVILDGLDDGDSVVLSGQFLIDSEASLKATFGRLGAGDATPATAMPSAAAQPAPSAAMPPAAAHAHKHVHDHAETRP